VVRVPVKSPVFLCNWCFHVSVLVLCTFYSYDCENKRSGISNETDNLHKILFKNSKAAFDAHDMLKIIRAVHLCRTRKLYLEFTFQEGGENSVDHFKSSGTPSSSIYKGTSRNPGDGLSTIKDAIMHSMRMSGENAHTYGALRNVLWQPGNNVYVFSIS
jgi:hypothetical protein